MAGFVLHDSLKVLTQNGECQIDLCFGDITKLRRQDKVDVLMVSAFRGDYTPTASSVIGALKRSLGLNVRDLARNKEEDLRNLYSCWWSHPLPDKMPYKRLLCFETKTFGMGRPQELVANVYRCLVPILNNEDGTVITPLLNTGDQGYNQVSMLQGMVVAAVNWMKAGLPLRLLKIVLYAKITDDKLSAATLKRFTPVCHKFAELKERYDSQYLVPKAVPIEFDIYLSYCEDDKGVVEAIQNKLKADKQDIRIFGEHQEIDEEAVWQQDMYQVMMRSARVVTVLSPHYLKSTACVEQYNIALCCNRRAHRDMLAPFYVDSIELMPTYMGLVQYVDCRPNDAKKIHEACLSLLGSMTIKVHLETLTVDPAPIQYDIFVSYSHRDDKIAKKVIKLLQKLAPKLRIFFDIQELKTGKAWQRTLYHSIDGSRCLLALISENYTKSPVCQEEYNLALAKHCSGDGSMQLVPLCLEDLKEVPATFSKVKLIKATPDVFDAVTSTVCKAVVSWLTGKQVDADVQHILNQDENPSCDVKQVSEDQRSRDFTTKYGSADKKLLSMKKDFAEKIHLHLKESTSDATSDEKGEVVDIVFSCAQEDWKYATVLKAIFKDTAPDLVVKTPTNADKDRLILMDTAQCVVAFLSPNYLDSPEQVEEFHIALCRQRISPATVLFPLIIHPLPQKPTYFHLVPCTLNISDSLWAALGTKWNVHMPLSQIDLGRGYDADKSVPAEEALGLHEAAHILIERLAENKRVLVAADSTFTRPVLHNVPRIQDELQKGSKGSKDTIKLAKILINLSLKE
ncbi:uncharacterized protein [Amphiura filiformis]|uniref:uncharacterized protein n=1 Tax=Amphiura filiformis TaxID=82378 RepID=UPI003B21BE9B